MALLFAIVYWLASDVLREQARVSVSGEMQDLISVANTGTRDRLVAEIKRRVAASTVQDLYYGLHDGDGTLLAGDLPIAPKREGWQEFSAPNPTAGRRIADAPDDPETNLLATTRRLDDGRMLTVAIDIFKISEAQEAIARAFAWAAGVGVALALFGGMLMSRAFLRRVESVNRSFETIAAGHMDHRLLTSGSGDELDQLAQNFNGLLDRLQASMDGLKQVSDDIAHDLRTPLSHLRQSLEAASLNAGSMDDYATAVGQAIADTDAILATFTGLLRIAQIEAGSRKDGFGDVDLTSVVLSVVESFAPVAEDRGRFLTGNVAPAIRCHGDRELLTQMVVNLVANGLNHTPPGSHILVSLTDGPPGTRCVVSDDGPGIPAEDRENVFRRFFRLDRSRTTPGNGLGLSLVAAIAKLHDIDLSLADNEPGLKVEIRFPGTIDSVPAAGTGNG